jgi:hypothetical protein
LRKYRLTHLFVVLDGLFEESLHFFWKFTGILMAEPADVFALEEEQFLLI